MSKVRVTKDVFLERLHEKYGDKITHIDVSFNFYDKSQKFNCKTHGDFTCTPKNIMRKTRSGCGRCGVESYAKKNNSLGIMRCEKQEIFGVGHRDVVAHFAGKALRSAKIWYALLARCYCKKTQAKKPSYVGCTLSDEWLVYSKFKHDVENMAGFDKMDWELDKDILVEGNKIYSLETCLFVPREINSVFKQPSRSKKGLPTGVLPYNSKEGVRYTAYCSTGNKGVRRNVGTFKTLSEAEGAYLRAKYEGIVRLCEKYSTDLSLETKSVILEQAKRKTLDKISAGNI